jgi:hypothetical protein
LARHYFYQCLSLAYVSTLIDDELHTAVTLVHCTRPAIDGDGAQAIQPNIAEMSLVNLVSRERFAEPLVRKCVELGKGRHRYSCNFRIRCR